jgi:hypothetical protein
MTKQRRLIFLMVRVRGTKPKTKTSSGLHSKIVRADDPKKTDIKYPFATNMCCKSKRLLKRYKERWGIEASYRKHNEFLAKTTSKNYTVRLLYYAVAILIYNCWCILNALQDQGRCNDAEEIIMLEVKVAMLKLFFSLVTSARWRGSDGKRSRAYSQLLSKRIPTMK